MKKMRKLQGKLSNLCDKIGRFFIFLSVDVRYFCHPPEASTTKEFVFWRMKHPLKAWYYENLLKI